MKKTVAGCLVLAACIWMIMVWPLGLIRKDVKLEAPYLEEYGVTYPLEPNMVVRQQFIAQEKILKSVLVRFTHGSDVPADLHVRFQLLDTEGDGTLYEDEIGIQEILPYDTWLIEFQEAPISLKTGHTYALQFRADCTTTANLFFRTMPESSEYTKGDGEFTIDGQWFPGRLYTEYVYSENMDLKNTLFHWVSIALILGSLLALLFGKQREMQFRTKDEYNVK